jgi:hypothetical protein
VLAERDETFTGVSGGEKVKVPLELHVHEGAKIGLLSSQIVRLERPGREWRARRDTAGQLAYAIPKLVVVEDMRYESQGESVLRG